MIFPGFGGYSPILPAPVNTSILALFQEAMDRDRPRSGPGREMLEMRREVSFDVLHRYVNAQSHERACEIVKRAWATGDRFCLYLRNFTLGARTLEPVPRQHMADGRVMQEISSVILMEDDRFQRALARDVAGELPVIGLENPAFDFRHEHSIPRLTLPSDAWKTTVSTLIAAAEVIILYFDEPTPGVTEEISLLRHHARQDATVLALSSNAAVAGQLDDFPVTFAWTEHPSGPVHLAALVRSMPPQADRRRFATEIPAPPAPVPPRAIREECEFVVNAGLVLAGEELRTGKLVDAEDRLAVCVAMTIWGDIPEARVVALLGIARSQFLRHQPAYGATNLGRALDTGEWLVRVGRLEPASLAAMLSGFPEFLEPYRGEAKAQQLLARIRVLENGGPASAART